MLGFLNRKLDFRIFQRILQRLIYPVISVQSRAHDPDCMFVYQNEEVPSETNSLTDLIFLSNSLLHSPIFSLIHRRDLLFLVFSNGC